MFIDAVYSKPIYGKVLDFDTEKLVSSLHEVDFQTVNQPGLDLSKTLTTGVSSNLNILGLPLLNFDARLVSNFNKIISIRNQKIIIDLQSQIDNDLFVHSKITNNLFSYINENDSVFYSFLGLNLGPTGGLFQGRVIDMLSFSFFSPVFNLADSFVCIGVFCILFFQTNIVLNKKKPLWADLKAVFRR